MKKIFLTGLLSFFLISATFFSYAVTYSPYYDTGLKPGWDNSKGHSTLANIADIASEAKINAITLAFVQAPKPAKSSHGIPGVCWGGQPEYSVENAWGADQIKAFQTNGGTVTISFGGQSAGATDKGYIAENYATASDLAQAYQKVLDAYPNVNRLDWDIEGERIEPKVNDPKPNIFHKMGEAISILHQNTPNLYISITVRAMPNGLSKNVIKILNTLSESGSKHARVNIMAMDYGDNEQDMAKAAIQAANNVKNQMKIPYDAIGIIPMIGINDTAENNPKEIFTLEDAVKVYNFAKANNISLGSWSLNRDYGAAVTPNPPKVSNDNCGFWIADYAFANAFQTGKITPAPAIPDIKVTISDKSGNNFYINPEYQIDGKNAGRMNDDKSFTISSGTHVIGLTIGSEPAVCPSYKFKEHIPVTIQINGYKWGSGKIDCTFIPSKTDL